MNINKKFLSVLVVLAFATLLFAQEWTFSGFVPSKSDKRFLDEVSKLCEKGAYDEADKILKDYKSKNPDSEYVKRLNGFASSGSVSDAENEKAASLYNGGKYKESLDVADGILKRKPKDYKALENRAAALSELDPKTAVKECDAILYFYPKNPKLLFLRGRAYFNLDDYENALKSDSLSVALDPSPTNSAHMDMARIYKETNELKKCAEKCENFIKAGGKEFIAYDLLSFVRTREGKYDEALKLGDAYLKYNKASGNMLKSRTYFSMKEYEKSVAAANKAIEADSMYVDAFSMLGIAYIKLGKMDKAIEALDKSILYGEKKPDSKRDIEKNRKNTLRIDYNNRAYAHFKSLEFKKAVDDFQNALQYASTEAERKSILEQIEKVSPFAEKQELSWEFLDSEISDGDRTVLNDVRGKLENGNYEKAKKEFEDYFFGENCQSEAYLKKLKKFTANRPALSDMKNDVIQMYLTDKFSSSSVSEPKRNLKKTPTSYTNIIRLLTALSEREPKEAVEKCDEFLSYYPLNALILFVRGRAYYNLGQTDKALKDYSASLFLEGNSLAYSWRGDLYQYNMGDLEAALKDYISSIKLNPKGENEAYSSRSDVYRKQEKLKECETDCTTYINAGGKSATAFSNIVELCSSRGDYDDAFKYADKFIALHPKGAVGYFLRGMTYFSKGDNENCLKECKNAAKKDSSYIYAYALQSAVYNRMENYEKAIFLASKAVKYAEKKNPSMSVAAYKLRGYAYIHAKKQKEALADFEKAMQVATDSQKEELLEGIHEACRLTSGYECVKFKLVNGNIVLSVPIAGDSENSNFSFVFDSSGKAGYLSEKGIRKLNVMLGEDIHTLMRKEMAKHKEVTAQEIEEYMKLVEEGKRILVKLNNLWLGAQHLPEQYFLTLVNKNFAEDGILCLDTFKDVKNIVIDYRNQTLEINSPIPRKNGVPLYKSDSNLLYGYYILAELNGVKQPFLLNFSIPPVILRERTDESKVYGEKDLELLISQAQEPQNGAGIQNKGVSRLVTIKIGNVSEDIVSYPYNYPDLHFDEQRLRAIYSLYNSIGYAFFKDKCVQLDFEHGMFYVW